MATDQSLSPCPRCEDDGERGTRECARCRGIGVLRAPRTGSEPAKVVDCPGCADSVEPGRVWCDCAYGQAQKAEYEAEKAQERAEREAEWERLYQALHQPRPDPKAFAECYRHHEYRASRGVVARLAAQVAGRKCQTCGSTITADDVEAMAEATVLGTDMDESFTAMDAKDGERKLTQCWSCFAREFIEFAEQSEERTAAWIDEWGKAYDEHIAEVAGNNV